MINNVLPIDNTLFTVPVSAGILFIIVGAILYKFPPKKINIIYGYRTVRSMKSKDRWDFAQNYSAKQLITFGGVLAFLSTIGFVFQPNENTAKIISAVLILSIVISIIYRVETALGNRFQTK